MYLCFHLLVNIHTWPLKKKNSPSIEEHEVKHKSLSLPCSLIKNSYQSLANISRGSLCKLNCIGIWILFWHLCTLFHALHLSLHIALRLFDIHAYRSASHSEMALWYFFGLIYFTRSLLMTFQIVSIILLIIIMAVVSTFLDISVQQIPITETAELKGICIQIFDRYAQTALPSSYQQCIRVIVTLHPHPVQHVMSPFALYWLILQFRGKDMGWPRNVWDNELKVLFLEKVQC